MNKSYEQLTRNGQWARHARHKKKCSVCTAVVDCPNCPRHPGRSRAQIKAGIKAKSIRHHYAVFNPKFPSPNHCYWCGVSIGKPANCWNCKTPFDPVKSEATAKRQSKGYFDHIEDSAVRENKKPKRLIQRIQYRRWYFGV